MKNVSDNQLNHAIEILARLVSFESLPGQPTHGIIGYIESYLAEHNVKCHLSWDESGDRANLFATIGPEIDGGVVLNGHTDVVPVEGQPWATDPFTLTRNGERLYGRGSVDMKGYLACALASVPHWKASTLQKPIHIAFTFDEEIGGFGMPVLLETFANNPYPDSKFEPPYTTFNIGTIEGGMVRNATAGWCNFDWELRQMPGVDGKKIIAEVEAFAEEKLLPDMRSVYPKSEINIITEAPVPPLDDSNADVAAELISRVTGVNSRGVVSFGSDAGYFSDAGYSTVLYGPGSISRAHKPDEYIETSELVEGLDFMQKLSKYLAD